jgi:hypothetical protein
MEFKQKVNPPLSEEKAMQYLKISYVIKNTLLNNEK